MTDKLRRSKNDRILAGVCGGLGEYFGIDSNIIRIIWLLVIFIGGTGLLLYLILWILMPGSVDD